MRDPKYQCNLGGERRQAGFPGSDQGRHETLPGVQSVIDKQDSTAICGSAWLQRRG
jgi:hypothetical protein